MTAVQYAARSTTSARATVTTVKVFGALTAFAGVEHGVGEMAQGSVPPGAVLFESWPQVAAFEPLSGEPAMSLVPNLLVSGVLSVVVATAFGWVAVHRPDRRHSAQLLLGLSLLLLLVGGGFGPPLLGALTALLAARLGATPARRPGRVTRRGARLWPWPLVAAAGSFLALVPGTAVLYLASGRSSPTVVAVLTATAFIATPLAMWTARAGDRVGTRGTGLVSASG